MKSATLTHSTMHMVYFGIVVVIFWYSCCNIWPTLFNFGVESDSQAQTCSTMASPRLLLNRGRSDWFIGFCVCYLVAMMQHSTYACTYTVNSS